jgi:hypothetical protein
MPGGWYLKLTFCFMVTTHESLHLDEQSFEQWKMVDIPTSSIWIIIFSTQIVGPVLLKTLLFKNRRKTFSESIVIGSL